MNLGDDHRIVYMSLGHGPDFSQSRPWRECGSLVGLGAQPLNQRPARRSRYRIFMVKCSPNLSSGKWSGNKFEENAATETVGKLQIKLRLILTEETN